MAEPLRRCPTCAITITTNQLNQNGPSLTGFSGPPPSLSEIPGLPGSVGSSLNNPSLSGAPSVSPEIPGLPGSVGSPLNNPALAGPPPVPPPSTNNSSAACQTGGSGGGGGSPAALGSQNNNALTSGVDKNLASASQCGIQNFESRNPGFKAYAFSGVSSRPVAGSKHPSGQAVDFAIYGSDGKLINNLRTNDSPASGVYGALYNNINQCWSQSGDSRSLGWGGNFQSGSTRGDSMHVQIGGTRREIGQSFPGTVQNNLGGNPNSTTYKGPTSGAEINRLDNSAARGDTPAALGSQSNAALNSSGSNSSAACASPTSGGCAAAAPGAAPVAAAAAAGAGLGGLLTSAIGQISQVAGQIAQGGLPAAAQGLAQLATQGAAGAAMLPTTVSQTVSNFVSNAGGAAFNAVRGLLAQ